MNKVICACFDLGYVLSDISDNGRAVSTVHRDTFQEYQPFLPPVSEQELCERVRQRVPALCPRPIVNSTSHSSVEYSQSGYMLKSHYIFCLLPMRFFPHV